MNRIVVFLLAPLPAAVIGGLVSWGTGAHPRMVSVSVFYLFQLYALQLLFGLAIHAWIRRRGHRSIMSCAMGGAAMVAIVAVPYLLWASVTAGNSASRMMLVLLLWLALGAITGATAWALGRQGTQSTPAGS